MIQTGDSAVDLALGGPVYVTSTTCLSSSIRGASSFSRLMMRPEDTQRSVVRIIRIRKPLLSLYKNIQRNQECCSLSVQTTEKKKKKKRFAENI